MRIFAVGSYVLFEGDEHGSIVPYSWSEWFRGAQMVVISLMLWSTNGFHVFNHWHCPRADSSTSKWASRLWYGISLSLGNSLCQTA